MGYAIELYSVPALHSLIIPFIPLELLTLVFPVTMSTASPLTVLTVVCDDFESWQVV